MTKKQLIDYIRYHSQMSISSKNYFFEMYQKDRCNDYYFAQFMTWRNVCEILEDILENIK